MRLASCRSQPGAVVASCAAALQTLVGLARALCDVPHLQQRRSGLSACRQLALRAIWSMQSLDAGMSHFLVDSLVRSLLSCVLTPALRSPRFRLALCNRCVPQTRSAVPAAREACAAPS